MTWWDTHRYTLEMGRKNGQNQLHCSTALALSVSVPFSFSCPYSTPVPASVMVHSSITFLTLKRSVVLCFFCWAACYQVTYFFHVSFSSPLEKNWEECMVEQASFSDAAVKWRPELERFLKPQTKKCIMCSNNSFEWLTWALHLKLDLDGSDDV